MGEQIVAQAYNEMLRAEKGPTSFLQYVWILKHYLKWRVENKGNRLVLCKILEKAKV